MVVQKYRIIKLIIFLMPLGNYCLGQHLSIGADFGTTKTYFEKESSNSDGFKVKRNYNGHFFSLKTKYSLGSHTRIVSGFGYERISTGFTSMVITLGGARFPETVTNLDYITVPIAFEFIFGKELRYFTRIGQEFSWLTNESIEHKGFWNPGWSPNIYTPNYRKFNQSIIGGLGIEYILRQKLIINASIMGNYGVFDMNKKNEDTPIKINSIRFGLGAGYCFG